MSQPIARVIHTGPGISHQGLPRQGLRRYGVPPSGPLDPNAAASANALLGQLAYDTVIEIALGGGHLKILEDTWIAHSGGLTCDTLPSNTARRVSAGETLLFTPSNDGCWSYLAIPGGWTADTILSSTSYHARSQLGSPIFKETILQGDPAPDLYPSISRRRLPTREKRDCIRLHPGPHFDLFLDPEELIQSRFTISPLSDRTGYRLSESLAPLVLPDLKSLPTLPGCIQVPPSGQPIVTLHDGPTVGGYPIIAVISPEDLPHFVQTPPNSSIQFTWHDTSS